MLIINLNLIITFLRDLGVHIDGYIALVAHTVVVGDKPVDARKADAILAAYNAVQIALKSLKPGNKNQDVIIKIYI